MIKDLLLNYKLMTKNIQKNIKIVWVGNSGCNIINTFIELGLPWVEFIWINTDKNSLSYCLANSKIQIWVNLLNGTWSGSNIDKGEKAALENEIEIKNELKGADIVIIVYGLCWWNGSWAWPIIANITKNMGIKTIAIITKPFYWEFTDRPWRRWNFETWIQNLKKVLDNVILILNDDIKNINEKMSFKEIFKIVDQKIYSEVKETINTLIKD